MNSQVKQARMAEPIICLRSKAIVASSLKTISLTSDFLQLPGEKMEDDAREGLREALARTRKRLERLHKMLDKMK